MAYGLPIKNGESFQVAMSARDSQRVNPNPSSAAVQLWRQDAILEAIDAEKPVELAVPDSRWLAP